MDDWIKDAESNKWNTLETVLHAWRLISLPMNLSFNALNSHDTEAVDAGISYYQSWEGDRFYCGLLFR